MDSENKVVNSGNVDYWEIRWIENRTGWHSPKVNEFLLRNYELVTGQKLPDVPLNADSIEFKNNSKKTWFIPLCGKTLDIPFLLSLGYNIFAVEGVRKAIETLDNENNLGLQLEENNSVYVGAGGRLRIYFGDLFQCEIEKFGPIDYIWDRGSFIALEYSFRYTYKIMMQRALKNSNGKYCDFAYLLETVQYDKTKFPGPPRCVDDEDIEIFFKDWAKVKFLEKEPLPKSHNIRKAVDIGPDVDTRIFLVTPKI